MLRKMSRLRSLSSLISGCGVSFILAKTPRPTGQAGPRPVRRVECKNGPGGRQLGVEYARVRAREPSMRSFRRFGVPNDPGKPESAVLKCLDAAAGAD